MKTEEFYKILVKNGIIKPEEKVKKCRITRNDILLERLDFICDELPEKISLFRDFYFLIKKGTNRKRIDQIRRLLVTAESLNKRLDEEILNESY